MNDVLFVLFEGWNPWLRAGTIAAGVVVLALLFHYVFFRSLASLGRRRQSLLLFGGHLLRYSRAPFRLLFPLLGMVLALPLITAGLSPEAVAALADVLYILFVVGLTWLLIRLTAVLQAVVSERFTLEVEDNLTARKVRTQVGILRRILILVVVVIGISAILLRYDTFRELGTGLLASAGVAGIIIGFAAQRTLGNLVAGFQIAITQPIRVDDVVIVEGEWGKIEEITLTYVVVRIWDQRRLVLPISYFLEQPFQNWTRTTAELLGTVFLYVDFTVPVEAVRAELHRILEASEYWDGKVWRLHVTDLTDRTVELRALMSAADAGRAFELRCEVRERLIAFIQQTYPESLPVLRAHLGEGEAPGGRRESGAPLPTQASSSADVMSR